MNVEKSELQRRDRDQTANEDAPFVPPETTTLSVRSTVNIPNGKTVIVGGMQTTSEASLSQRIILASARIVNPTNGSKQSGAAGTDPKHLKVFRLQFANATEIAKIVNELFAGGKTPIRVVADERTNTLIIQSEKGMMDAVETLINTLLDKVKK